MIREMTLGDSAEVLDMMRAFYATPAIIFKAGDDILRRDIADCVGECPFIDGMIIESEGRTAGYAMAATGYTTEFGGVCIWLEDLYIKPEYRGRGLANELFDYLKARYAGAARIRLEVEPENEGAIAVYISNGFDTVPYVEMDYKPRPN